MLTLKKHRFLLLNLLVLCILSLFVVKYCEEIQTLKQDIFYSLFYLNHTGTDVSNTIPAEESSAPAGTADNSALPISIQPVEVTEDAWFADHPLIYHAGGDIQGYRYTNSLEAIEETLSKKQYFIEIDLQYTSDNHLVCAHTWSDVYPEEYHPTLEEFLTAKVQGKFTPLTAEDLLNIMSDNPQMFIVIDVKEPGTICNVITDLVALANRDSAILDRFIIQLYTGKEKASIQEIYPFEDQQFLFTLYAIGYWQMELAALCNEENISVITLPQGWMPAEDAALLNTLGFTIYEHTVNRIDIAHHSLEKGISSFYTDVLSPSDLMPQASTEHSEK